MGGREKRSRGRHGQAYKALSALARRWARLSSHSVATGTESDWRERSVESRRSNGSFACVTQRLLGGQRVVHPGAMPRSLALE